MFTTLGVVLKLCSKIVRVVVTTWKTPKLLPLRLTNLVLLIALAYTCAGLRGQLIKSKGQQKYIVRLKELNRLQQRHSNFWIGLYGQMWIAALESCTNWVRNLMMIRPNKRIFFQRGLRAMALIQEAF